MFMLIHYVLICILERSLSRSPALPFSIGDYFRVELNPVKRANITDNVTRRS